MITAKVREIDAEAHRLRIRAIEVLEYWWHEREKSRIKPQHSLVTVQEMQLSDRAGGNVTAAEKPSMRSRPPITDMPALARQFEPVMRHIGAVNHRWLKAMEGYVEHGTLRKAASQRRIPASKLYRDFNQGLAVLQSEMVRLGL